METYKQKIRIHEGNYVTMLDMVSDLTGYVRGYYKNWKRPLTKRREDLQRAKRLGRTIVQVASERPWREGALQDILRSLLVQDRQMHRLVSGILTEARISQEIAKHKDLHDQLQVALHEGDTREIWEVSRELYTLSHQTLDLLDKDASNAAAFSHQLDRLKREDPLTYRRITLTLNQVARVQSEDGKRGIPKPRSARGEFGVWRSG